MTYIARRAQDLQNSKQVVSLSRILPQRKKKTLRSPLNSLVFCYSSMTSVGIIPPQGPLTDRPCTNREPSFRCTHHAGCVTPRRHERYARGLRVAWSIDSTHAVAGWLGQSPRLTHLVPNPTHENVTFLGIRERTAKFGTRLVSLETEKSPKCPRLVSSRTLN